MKKKIKPHNISSDNFHNKPLREELGGLRGLMLNQTNKIPTPKGFTIQPHPDHPQMVFINMKTGKRHDVPLFAYREVLEALNALL